MNPNAVAWTPSASAAFAAGSNWHEETNANTDMPIAPAPVNAEEPEEEIDPAYLKQGDPREHLNLVFIGHVDAGNSTLSGSILYLAGNVDKREIEKYKLDAKALDRESWFSPFITSRRACQG